MKTSKSRKVLFWSIGLFLLLLIGSYGVFSWVNYSNAFDRMSTKVLGLDELEVLEKRFSDSPNFPDCFTILDRVGHTLKQYDRSIEYGKRCLELPRPVEKVDWIVHYWLAEFYNKKGDEKHSLIHLKLALQLDKNNIILTNDWLSQGGLNGIYTKI